MFKTLHTDTIESLVIAYGKSEASDDLLTSLKCLWSVIEEYVNNGKLSSVGVSDVDTDVFIQLFQWAKVSLIMALYQILISFINKLIHQFFR